MQEFKKRGLSACLNLSIGYADNGQPQGLSLRTVAIDISRISCRCRGSGASRSPHPTKCAAIRLCRFRGQMISAPTYFERSETDSAVSAFAEPAPLSEVPEYIQRYSIYPSTKPTCPKLISGRLVVFTLRPPEGLIFNIRGSYQPR